MSAPKVTKEMVEVGHATRLFGYGGKKTVCTFEDHDVPVGTKLYASATVGDSLTHRTCKWIQGDTLDSVDDYYKTECGHTFYLFEGGIEDNNCKFCMYCGGSVVEVIPSDEDES
jgi:hypothetical protein